TGRFLHRDLGGFTVDFEHRKKMGMEERASLPFIDDFAKEYHLDRAVERLKDVRVYFSGGFVYNIDQELPKWQEKGWVSGDKVAPGTFEAQFETALSNELMKRTGRPLLDETAKGLVDATTKAREVAIADAKRAAAAAKPVAGRFTFFDFFAKAFDGIARFFRGEPRTTTPRETTARETTERATGRGGELARDRGISRTAGLNGSMDGYLKDRVEERTRERTRGR
ncbi:MAG: hypothetical protein ACAI25_10995, partial [Planctomycetota bacterium]